MTIAMQYTRPERKDVTASLERRKREYAERRREDAENNGPRRGPLPIPPAESPQQRQQQP